MKILSLSKHGVNNGGGRAMQPDCIRFSITSHGAGGKEALAVSMGKLVAKRIGFRDRDYATAGLFEDGGTIYVGLRISPTGCVVDAKRGSSFRVRFGACTFDSDAFGELSRVIGGRSVEVNLRRASRYEGYELFPIDRPATTTAPRLIDVANNARST